jgi:hypothetical protein
MAYRYSIWMMGVLLPLACGGGTSTRVERTGDQDPVYNTQAPHNVSEQPARSSQQPAGNPQTPSRNPQGIDETENSVPEQPGVGGSRGIDPPTGGAGRPPTGEAGGPSVPGCPTDCDACIGACQQCVCRTSDVTECLDECSATGD